VLTITPEFPDIEIPVDISPELEVKDPVLYVPRGVVDPKIVFGPFVGESVDEFIVFPEFAAVDVVIIPSIVLLDIVCTKLDVTNPVLDMIVVDIEYPKEVTIAVLAEALPIVVVVVPPPVPVFKVLEKFKVSIDDPVNAVDDMFPNDTVLPKVVPVAVSPKLTVRDPVTDALKGVEVRIELAERVLDPVFKEVVLPTKVELEFRAV
jgi:hypothetical protein